MLRRIADEVMKIPLVYDAYQRAVGAPKCHRIFIEDFVRPKISARVLDLGCGVGASLRYLPVLSKYVGIDIDSNYIDAARARYANRGVFLCSGVEHISPTELGKFDLVIAFGVFHHLSDDVAHGMIELAKSCLDQGGRFITIDPCIVDDDSLISSFLIRHDRGRNVRRKSEYEALFAGKLVPVSTIVQSLLNIPYSQIIIESTVN